MSLATAQYDEGVSDFLAVVDAERSLHSAEDRLVQSQTALTLHTIRLFKALGGGWDSWADPRQSRRPNPPREWQAARPRRHSAWQGGVDPAIDVVLSEVVGSGGPTVPTDPKVLFFIVCGSGTRAGKENSSCFIPSASFRGGCWS